MPKILYIVYLKNVSGNINLKKITENFQIKWYDPRNGGDLHKGKIKSIKGGKTVVLSGAPDNPEKDWVVVISLNASS